MTRTMKLFPLLALSLVLAIGLTGCPGDDPETCEDQGLVTCSTGDCHACCIDDDCAATEICNESYECEEVCTPKDADCSRDRGACCEGLACSLFTSTCIDVCTADGDCATMHADVDFATDLQCQGNGTCDFQHCSNDGNCRPGTVCYNGDCVTPADCAQIASCRVVPGSVVTQDGTSVTLSATALLTSGALAPGATFSWGSSDDTIAAVTGGVIVGGVTTGTATVTATVAGCATTCDASVLNYGAVAGGARVVAINELTGAPLAGIAVDIEGVGSEVTDADGVANFAGADLTATPANVTLSGAGVGYVSFMAADSNDIIAHLGLQIDTSKSGGFVGKFDFSKIICEPGNPCEVKLGFTGASIPGNLFNLSIDSLIGEMIMTHIELGGTSEDIGLPGGLVLGLNDTWFREDYQATGTEGTRVAWGLGGKLNLADLIELLGPVISGGEIDIGAILGAVLPMFAGFYTSVVPNVDISLRDKVADVNDINGDGDTSDMVPDYGNFPALPGGDMVLKVPMDQTMTVSIPNMPSDGAGGYLYDSVILLAGVLVRDAGLVPLGLTAGMDAATAEDTPDGVIDSVSLSVSDVAGRLPEGTYERVVVALALNIAKLTDSENTDPMVISGQVIFVDDFTGTMSMGALMEPAAYNFDVGTRTVTVDSLPADHDALLVLGSGDAGSWQVFHPGATGAIAMPAAPAAGDRMDGVGIGVLSFADGVTYSDLISFNDTNLVDLVTLVENFVVVYGSEGGGGLDISCATQASKGSLLGVFLLLGLALLRRRK